jgi:TorA maturation chaperone TorD
MTISEGTQIALAGRAYSYLLFQNLFGEEPTKRLLDALYEETTRRTLGLFALDGDSSYTAALSSAIAMLDAERDNQEKTVEKLRSEYTRLYLGPGDLKAPPWESVYVSKKRQLFDENTLKVRNFYRSQGFLPAEYPRVADDHIALECAFMAKLGERAIEAYGAGNVELAKMAFDASKRFLEEHLLVWLPGYIADLSEVGNADFYPIMAKLAFEFMLVDRLLLEELVDEP